MLKDKVMRGIKDKIQAWIIYWTEDVRLYFPSDLSMARAAGQQSGSSCSSSSLLSSDRTYWGRLTGNLVNINIVI